MGFILRATAVVFVLLVVGAGTLAGYYYGLRQPVPDLETRAEADTRLEPSAGPSAVAAAEARLAQLRREGGYPSVSVAVASGGIVVWQQAQGYADLASGRRASVDTVYAIGSVSKPLTAAVVMRLAERGVLSLDADMHAYVPSFPAKPHAITARQLLSHQSGIRHYRFELSPPLFSDFGSNVEYENVADSLPIFADDPLLFEPDTSFHYSTYGYTLLSAAVEGAAKMPFLYVMQTELFSPFAMVSTGADDKLKPVPGRAGDYLSLLRDGYVIAAPATNSSNKWAGGGFRATPRDLALFGAALLAGEIVGQESLKAMFTPRTLKDGSDNPQNYGLGFRIHSITGEAYPGKSWRAVHHGGVAAGSQAMLVLLPERDIVVALAANAATQPPGLGMFDAATDIAVYFAEGPSAAR